MNDDQLRKIGEQAALKQSFKDGNTPRQQGGSDELLDLDEVKASLRSAFLGYTYQTKWRTNEDGEEQAVRVKNWRVENPDEYTPICNEKALEDFFVPIEGVANINTAGSYLTDKQIESLGTGVMFAIVDQITENHEEYGIDSMADANQIVATIRSVLMAALSKGRDGRMMQHRERSIVERVVKTMSGNEKKGRFF